MFLVSCFKFLAQGQLMHTTQAFYRVEKSRIGFLKFIFEGYDNLAVLTTLDSAAGLVRLTISPGCSCEAFAVMADLKKDIMINEV